MHHATSCLSIFSTQLTRRIQTHTMTNPPTPLSYKDAGVDIDAGDALVERIKPLAKKTMREGVLAGIGGFGALFEVPKRYKEPEIGRAHV